MDGLVHRSSVLMSYNRQLYDCFMHLETTMAAGYCVILLMSSYVYGRECRRSSVSILVVVNAWSSTSVPPNVSMLSFLHIWKMLGDRLS